MIPKDKVEESLVQTVMGDPRMGKLFGVLLDSSMEMTMKSAKLANNVGNGTYYALANVLGSLQVVACLLAPSHVHEIDGEEFEASSSAGVNNETISMAVALVMAMCEHRHNNDDKEVVAAHVKWGADVFHKALETFTKLTGHAPTPALFNPTFLAAAENGKALKQVLN